MRAFPMPASVHRITVTRVEYTTGKGTEDDVARRIIELHDGDRGPFLRWDPHYDHVEVSHIPLETGDEA